MNKMDAELRSLVAVNKEATHILASIIRSSNTASKQSSSTLIGTLGGFIGMGVSYALTLIAPISLPVVSVFLTGLGIIIALLVHRGPRRLNFEMRLEENRILTEEILSRIKNLPRNAPQEVKDELWHTYQTLNSMLGNQSKDHLALPAPGSSSVKKVRHKAITEQDNTNNSKVDT